MAPRPIPGEEEPKPEKRVPVEMKPPSIPNNSAFGKLAPATAIKTARPDIPMGSVNNIEGLL
jgi:hypothetical protein